MTDLNTMTCPQLEALNNELCALSRRLLDIFGGQDPYYLATLNKRSEIEQRMRDLH